MMEVSPSLAVGCVTSPRRSLSVQVGACAVVTGVWVGDTGWAVPVSEHLKK